MANSKGNPNLKPRWRKGQSGNPSGRSRIYHEVQKVAQQHSLEAIETLYGIMVDKRQAARNRLAACNAILDRGLGKPQTNLNFSSDGRPAHEFSNAELDDRIMQIMDELGKAAQKRASSKTEDDGNGGTVH